MKDSNSIRPAEEMVLEAERHGVLAELCLRFRPDIVDFVRRKFGGGPPDPEDVAQAVFLQLAAQGGPDIIEKPRSFLFKCAQNFVLDYHRRAGRQEATLLEYLPGRDEKMSEFDAERVVISEERLNMLVRLLERLPEHKRQMVLLSRIHDLSCADIGRQLGVSAEAVQKQIERVLKDCLTAMDRDE